MINEKTIVYNLDGETRVLKLLFLINGLMFFIEIFVGLISDSLGLVAGSLDMLSDAIAYGINFYAVGMSLIVKQKATRMSGYFQMLLSLGVILEAIRRFFYNSEPLGEYMIVISAVALMANLLCLSLLYKHRHGHEEVHLKASWIFSTNDVFVNLGIILAGVLIIVSGSHVFDLIIGIIVGLIVLRGAIIILRITSE